MEKTMKHLIEIPIVSILLTLAYFAANKDEAEANEWLIIDSNDPNDFTVLDATKSTDIMFCYYDVNGVTEEVTLDIVGDEIVCSRPAEKAIEIIFKSLYKCYGDFSRDIDDLTVRFEPPPEPNEPNEPNDVWVYDPNATITSDYIYKSEMDFTCDTLEMADTTMYLKNMPLLTKDEIRDFAIVIGAATARLSACDEFYEELLRLVPAKLLQDPDKPEPNESELMLVHPPEIKHVWECSCGQGWGEMFEISCGCGKVYKTLDIIMKCIPTWPDYIELDKDLMIDGDSLRYPITKGTKIYFKEDECEDVD